MKQLIKRLCLDTAYSFLRSNLSLIYKVTSDLDSSRSGSLTVTCLQEVQLAFLDGELHILHIMEVILKICSQIHELLVNFWHSLLQSRDRLWCTNTSNNVLALCI